MSVEQRLLCDEMLSSLARWLRAAGHDAALADHRAPDNELIERAEAENRVLLTRDRALFNRVEGAVLLPDALEAQARTLTARLALNWLHAPFTRCMAEGTPLKAAEPEDLFRIPRQSRDLPGPFTTCPTCRRLYWPGSHVRRMRARLEGWAQQA